MEANNMPASSENVLPLRVPKILNATITRDRFRTVTSQPKSSSISEPKESPSEPPQPKKQKESIDKKIKAGLVVLGSLLALEGAGATFTELTDKEPFLKNPAYTTQLGFIQKAGYDILHPLVWIKNLQTENISPEFNANAKQGIIAEGINTISVSQEELTQLYKDQSAKNKDNPTVVYPVAFTADGQRTDYKYLDPIKQTDSATGQVFYLEKPGSINVGITKSEALIVPSDNAEIFQFKPITLNGKEYFIGVFIKWEQNGQMYGLRIGASTDVRTLNPLENIKNAPFVPTNEAGTLLLSEAKDGKKLPLGTAICKVDLSNPNVKLNFDKYNPENGRWESIKPIFVTDNSDGQKKLVLPQNNN
jgi:hypothetical protein